MNYARMSLGEKMTNTDQGVLPRATNGNDKCAFRDPAFTANREWPVHRWVPWIAGYSRDFVEDALKRHVSGPSVVLDPFAGVGTTLVEADVAGHTTIGFEINPYAAFVARTKLNAYRIEPSSLRVAVESFKEFMYTAESEGTLPVSDAPASFRTRTPFYSECVERKVLWVLDFIANQPEEVAAIFKLAFASLMVTFSNYSYEPSLGRKVSAGRPEVDDYEVAESLARKLLDMADDIDWYREKRNCEQPTGEVYAESFFDGYERIQEGSVDIVVTSPPYLNNYHYNRNTRPHMYWLGFCSSPNDLKALELLNFGSYWQNARVHDLIELDDAIHSPELRSAIEDVRAQNPEKGVYGGNGWANYAARYFNDCWRFATGIKRCLRPGGTALVVIGNSILQGVPIATDRFLGEIGEEAGLELADIHVPRDTRVGNSIVDSSVRAGISKGHRLYESVVELRQTI